MTPPMARNERTVGPGWSHPRRSSLAKSRAGSSGRGPGTADLDGLGDIMSLLSGGERSRHKSDQWPSLRNGGCIRNYKPGECCWRNGKIQCNCLWPKRRFCVERQGCHNQNIGKSTVTTEPVLPFENKLPSLGYESSTPNGHFSDKNMVEEFILDDNEMCLLNFYDIPVDMTKRHQLRKVGKVKTVSIIDTLSELASGATDREDEGTFSSAVSESAIHLNRDPCHPVRPKAKHSRLISAKRGRGLRENFLPLTSPTTNFHVEVPLGSDSSELDGLNVCHETLCDSQLNSFHVDDANFTCSSLKRTLKYLRKAVSSSVVEEEPRSRRHARRQEEKDAFRLCFSDSEVREVPELWAPIRHEKLDLDTHSRCKSMFTVTSPVMTQISVSASTPRSKQKADVPEWIKTVFAAAKRGDVEKMREGLKDIDLTLVRNLSDDHGNNLWHICAANNHTCCLEWLCSHSQLQVDALGDENKHGFTPVALAVKHGSLYAVQWLIQHTISKSQLSPPPDTRSLLHIAAKYGQENIVQWLLDYMQCHSIDVNSPDSEGNTSLHLASKHGHIACVKAILFHNGNLKVRNERGLKPLNLAIKHSQGNCADYLLAMESCYSLAAGNLQLESDVQHLQKENAEMKNHFKELLVLTRRIQHRQRELVHTFSRLNQSGHMESDNNDRSDERCKKYLEDYSHLLATVMMDEEHRLLLIEDKWKKSRKQPKVTDYRKTPLDIMRSQFAQILDKVCDQSPAIPSTPETSDDSWQSGDDEPFTSSVPSFMPITDGFISAPDVIHTFPNQYQQPFVDSISKQHPNMKSNTLFGKNVEMEVLSENLSCTPSINKNQIANDIRTSTVRSISGSARNVNLQMFFKQNPNLRQAGETCSVLEVLEPSSSDSEECTNQKRRLSKNFKIEKEREKSSSSSALETYPSSYGPSSAGSKTSGSCSSINGNRQDHNGLGRIGNVPNVYNSDSGSKQKSETVDVCLHDSASKCSTEETNRELSHASSCEDSCSVEPDLIRGTQKKKNTLHIGQHDRENQTNNEQHSRTGDVNIADNPSISTEDSESLEADRSFSSAVDIPDSLLQGQIHPDPLVTGTGVKKKSFLLKFALRGRWPSKHRPRSLKNEISPEEFRETYSRSSLADNTSFSSHCIPPGESVVKKTLQQSTFPGKRQDDTPVLDTSGSTERLEENSLVLPPPCGETLRQTPIRTPLVLLPPRRDPPPAPPLPSRGGDRLQCHSDDDDDMSVPKSSASSCITNCLTPSSVSLHDPYSTPSASDLWRSPDSKSLFRPASSASRMESPSRAEENFPLNKSSSASTEMLSALDSSTAGRQSPAPSEVSKTESALSPPSDVSKTESTRYLSQLGRIEESSHLVGMKATTTHSKSADERSTNDCQQIKEERSDTKLKKKTVSSKKMDSDKPWYEISDEEDIITPQRYKAVTVSMRSSSEDEAVTG